MSRTLKWSDIVQRAGGATHIAAMSSCTPHEITNHAVWKWGLVPVPTRHWPLIIELTGLKPEDLYRANLLAEERRRTIPAKPAAKQGKAPGSAKTKRAA